MLSSNAGVGSIVATKWGGFVMPLTSSKWGSVFAVNDYLRRNSTELLNAAKIMDETGVEIVDDNRFVRTWYGNCAVPPDRSWRRARPGWRS